MNGLRGMMIALVVLAAAAFDATSARAGGEDRPTTATVVFPAAGDAPLIAKDGLKSLFEHHGATLLVANFWATYCPPCVAEMPGFVQADKKWRDKGVRVIGLSSDFADEAESTVKPFLKRKQIPYPNYVLDVDPNTWIAAFEPEWSGTLPATFFFDSTGRKLGWTSAPVTAEELDGLIQKYLKTAEPAKR